MSSIIETEVRSHHGELLSVSRQIVEYGNEHQKVTVVLCDMATSESQAAFYEVNDLMVEGMMDGAEQEYDA